MRYLELDALPGRSGHGRHLGVERRRAPAQRDEGDAQLVELGEVCVGCELGIEHQVARALAVFFLPELDEPQDLVSLLALSQIGIGVAEDLAFGVLREEGEYGFAPLAAARHVVLLYEGVLTEIGDRVKVEVERAGVDQLVLAKRFDPGAQEAADRLAPQPGGVLPHEGRLRDRVEPRGERDALVKDQIHHMAAA